MFPLILGTLCIKFQVKILIENLYKVKYIEGHMQSQNQTEKKSE